MITYVVYDDDGIVGIGDTKDDARDNACTVIMSDPYMLKMVVREYVDNECSTARASKALAKEIGESGFGVEFEIGDYGILITTGEYENETDVQRDEP